MNYDELAVYAWKQYMIPVTAQIMTDSPAMNYLIRSMMAEMALDLRDGPRLGPGRREWYRTQRNQRIRAAAGGRASGPFLRARSAA